MGITGFHDAGIGRETIALYEAMKAADKMDVRIYAMLTGWDRDLLQEWYEKGPRVDPDHLLTIRSVKLNCDGALGSRGAWLLEAYSDRPGHFGHETLPMEFVKETALNGLQYGFQVCSHAIGDRANREILDRYEAAFEEMPDRVQDHRYRIEHAQHLHPEDIPDLQHCRSSRPCRPSTFLQTVPGPSIGLEKKGSLKEPICGRHCWRAASLL